MNFKFMIIALLGLVLAACSQAPVPETSNKTLTKQFIVDGVGYAPEEMYQFEGALHYVANPDFHDYGILYAFTTRENAQTFMTEDLAKQALDPGLKVLAPLNNSKFYKDKDYKGEMLKVGRGQSYSDLRTVDDKNGSDFSNSISSMKCRTGVTTTVYDGTNFNGGSFNCQGTNLPELTRSALGLRSTDWQPSNDITSVNVGN